MTLFYSKKMIRVLLIVFCLLCGLVDSPGFAQEFQLPETILPEDLIRVILNEVSGQLPFNNEVRLAGYNRIRTEEELNTFFYEGKYLARKLREYGVDDVRLEDLAEYYPGRKESWLREDAELWMIEPEKRLLSRLAEHPALMARHCDSGEWQGELVYLDLRDISRLEEMELSGKIVLTPGSIRRFIPALEQGALGIISYDSFPGLFDDPFKVTFDISGMQQYDREKREWRKLALKHKVFGFKIWRRLGEQLKMKLLYGQKVVLRAAAKTKTYPLKLDTIFAAINGREPRRKGLMFTAHLFERPHKQGANDNASGAVTLVEVARTISKLIREGKIERPECAVFFLLMEEGAGTAAFFKKYPEMADKISAVINMDMVGENLAESRAFFNIDSPPYSRASFIESVAVNFADYVSAANMIRYDSYLDEFPLPIVEKNGSRQPFRYLVCRYTGSSDHVLFIQSDPGIPAVSFSVWPDPWFHTDKDRPDKSDPSQLKRVAFIGTASALAVCSGSEEILRNLIALTYKDRLVFIQEALLRGMKEISLLTASDGGTTFAQAKNYINQAVKVSKKALLEIGHLTRGKKRVHAYLESVVKNMDALSIYYAKYLQNHYKMEAGLKGFKPAYSRPSAEERRMKTVVPIKVEPLKLGVRYSTSPVLAAVRKDAEVTREIFRAYGYNYLVELYLLIDGKRDLAEIRDLLSFEFKPMPHETFAKIIALLKEADLILIPK